MSSVNRRMISKLKNLRKNGAKLSYHQPLPIPPDTRTPEQKRIDKENEKRKREEEALKLIEENKEKVFSLTFEQQDWEHEWNLEEYQKDRIERYENEYPRDESYEGVAQWCICYKCRPEWHSQPGGVIYLSKERNRENWELFKMQKEDSDREKKRLKLKHQEIQKRKIEKQKAKREKLENEKKEKERKEKEEQDKKMKEQEKEYNLLLIKEKDEERDKIYESKGWQKNISRKSGKIYWINKNTKESKWDKDMDIEYNVWIEFYSTTNHKFYWYNHKTHEKVWEQPKNN